MYVLLSGMLPFDSEDNKETARQTIYEPVPFDHQVWKYVSDESKDLIISKKHFLLVEGLELIVAFRIIGEGQVPKNSFGRRAFPSMDLQEKQGYSRVQENSQLD